MDTTAMYEAAAALWPLVGTGAAERLGAAGTEHGLKLLEQVRVDRRARGLPEDPASEKELAQELSLLPPSAAPAIKVVATIFNGEVEFNDRVSFGFSSDA